MSLLLLWDANQIEKTLQIAALTYQEFATRSMLAIAQDVRFGGAIAFGL
jgi:hypothetical protein